MALLICVSTSSVAQNTYEPLLRHVCVAPAPSNGVHPRDCQFEAALVRGIEDLRNREEQLVNLKSKVESYGHTALSFNAELQATVDSLSQEEMRLVLTGSPAEYLAIPQVRRMHNAIRTAKPSLQKLFRELDDYILDTLDLAMAIGLHSIQAEMRSSPPSSVLEAKYLSLISAKDRYLENKKYYGLGKDVYRTTSFQQFFSILRSMYQHLDTAQLSPVKKLRHRASVWTQKAAAIGRYLTPRTTLDLLTLLKVLVLNEQPRGQVNPLGRAVIQLSGHIGDRMPEKVEIDGLEHIPTTSASDEIYLFTPGHREALEDQVGMSSLGIDNFVAFAAVNNFLPDVLNKFFGLKDWLIERLSRNLGVVIVGKKTTEEPIDKALRILRETELRNILIYPGGRLPEGLGFTMGARQKFLDPAEGPIAMFEKAGYKVHIVPISMRDNARLLGGRRLTRSNVLHVKIAPVLSHEARQLLTRLGNAETLGLLMRYGLIEDMISNDELLWGQLRGSKLPDALSEFVGRTDCASLLLKDL